MERFDEGDMLIDATQTAPGNRRAPAKSDAAAPQDGGAMFAELVNQARSATATGGSANLADMLFGKRPAVDATAPRDPAPRDPAPRSRPAAEPSADATTAVAKPSARPVAKRRDDVREDDTDGGQAAADATAEPAAARTEHATPTDKTKTKPEASPEAAQETRPADDQTQQAQAQPQPAAPPPRQAASAPTGDENQLTPVQERALEAAAEKMIDLLAASGQAGGSAAATGQGGGANGLSQVMGQDGRIDLGKFAALFEKTAEFNPGFAAQLAAGLNRQLAAGGDAKGLDPLAGLGADDGPSDQFLAGWQVAAATASAPTAHGASNGNMMDASTWAAAAGVVPQQSGAEAAATTGAVMFAQFVPDGPAAARSGEADAAADAGLPGTTSGAAGRGDLNTAFAANATSQARAGDAARGTAQTASAQTPTFQSLLHTPPTDQVALHIVKASIDKIDAINIALNPAELGRVEVKLSLGADGTVNAVVRADNPATLELLMKDQSSLEKALQQAGLKTDDTSLSFNLRGDQGGDPRQQQFAQGNAQSTRSPGNGWRGNPTSDDVDPAELAVVAAQTRRTVAPDGALDIRI